MSRAPLLIEVCVLSDSEKPVRKPNAYTRYYNPASKGACIHHVMASSGTLAKIAAIHEHVAGQNCKPNGRSSWPR